MDRFEPENLARLFQHAYRQMADHPLDPLEPTVDCDRIAQPFCLDVVREVQVEEVGDGQADRGLQYARCDVGIAASHDLREELRFPHVLRVLFRRDRRRSATRQREVVYRHAPASALVHHVEPPGVVAAGACPTAFLFADLSNSHTVSLVYEARVGDPRRIQSRTSAGWNVLPLRPKRCEVRRPRKYARRTVSSWQPMNSATSNAVIRRLGNPLASDVPSAANCASAAVSTESGYAYFLIAPPPSSDVDTAVDAE
jgi:hypothetical protein